MYSIGMAQKKTGLTARQIRYYEQTGLIEVKRTNGNQRRFSDDDLQRLLDIKRLINQGYDVEDVKELLIKQAKEKPDDQVLKGGSKVLGENLTSLYPVSDRAELVSLLSSLKIQKPKEKKDK